MKSLVKYSLVGLFGLGLSTSAFAYTLDGTAATEVGLEDNFVAAEDLGNAGEQTETDWVNSILGTDLVFDVKTEDLVATPTFEDPDILAVELAAGDLYYIIKNATYSALFENVELLDWAVFDTSQTITVTEADGTTSTGLFSTFFNLSTDQLEISHISEFTGVVPEPSTVALMGLGLLGLGFSGRKWRT